MQRIKLVDFNSHKLHGTDMTEKKKETIHKKTTGGSGGDDGERLGRLESDVEYIKRDVHEIKTKLEKMDDKINQTNLLIHAEMKSIHSWISKLAIGLLLAVVLMPFLANFVQSAYKLPSQQSQEFKK
jgi:hypothetical protein